MWAAQFLRFDDQDAASSLRAVWATMGFGLPAAIGAQAGAAGAKHRSGQHHGRREPE